MIVVPEPVLWLAGLPEDALFAPWALTRVPARVPRALRGFVDRRRQPGARGVPGWWLLEGALRAWARGRTERTLRARFAVRDAVDRLAARAIARSRPARVVAPSCGAWRSFAAAREVGARCVLVEDLPDIRALHDDLDRAAAAHPGCGFLDNYRAADHIMVRQEVERALAHEVLVRGPLAAARIERAHPEVAIARLPMPPPPPIAAARPSTAPRVLLAGLAAARHGSVEALAMLERLPEITLVVRAGEGAEPRALLDHARVERNTGQPVHLVIAPAWVECHPHEVPAAIAAGVPVVASARAAGFHPVIECVPGDAAGLTAAVAAAL